MHPGPLFAWGTAAGRPVRPPGRGGNPPPPALEGAVAPGGLLPRAPDRALQASDEGGTGAAYPARAQVARQFDRAVADAPQAAYLETLRGPQPAHLAVASLVQHDPESAVAGPRGWSPRRRACNKGVGRARRPARHRAEASRHPDIPRRRSWPDRRGRRR